LAPYYLLRISIYRRVPLKKGRKISRKEGRAVQLTMQAPHRVRFISRTGIAEELDSFDRYLRPGADAETSPPTNTMISLAYRVDARGILMHLGNAVTEQSGVVT
jgi:hypothetical protein